MALVVVAAVALGQLWKGGLVLGLLLAIPAALAGIGAPTVRLPLACGAVMLVTAIVLATFAGGSLLWIAAPVPVVAVTAVSVIGVVLSRPREQELASVTPVAEVVQRAAAAAPRTGRPAGT